MYRNVECPAMLLKDEVDLLRKVPLFANMDPAKLKLLAFTSTRASFKPGQELFHQGDEGDAAYLILSGEADVIADTPSGEVPVATIGQNAVVGEIAILCEVPRTASVRAVSQARDAEDREGAFPPPHPRVPGHGGGDHARAWPAPDQDHRRAVPGPQRTRSRRRAEP
jgi:hypothetical protein